ncbi:L,D-transpeptidase [Methylobacterium brachythecii]|uniref:Lipoprotein-anchoring transpeptidase ErfK/SrfK n=2 Tax=Methylobacterium brachythecii TaxID=1176177 RepID=A0A7W6F5H1_9HYPH|nr:lipoprotein-anchoring transpeptidase ErfK/SrfK [Methylobacterium brachythecii]
MFKAISSSNRRRLLAGAASSLMLMGLAGPVSAQGAGGYDDARLYKDQYGKLYRKRGGEYVPYGGPVVNGRPVDDPSAALDADEYARRRAERYGEPPPAAAPGPQSPANAGDLPPEGQPGARPAPKQAGYPVPQREIDNGPIDIARAYAPVEGEPFNVPPINTKTFNKAFLRAEVDYRTNEPVGTIVVDPRAHYLYLVLPNGRARRYGVGVGKQGFSWNGTATINSKQAWPDWYPPKEMIERRPDLKAEVSKLQSGVGVPGGSRNPLGARAMYLWQNNKDTLFRIHGTTEPHSIGKSVSSGCIRMINQDAIDLFSRVQVGTRVVVL